MKELDHLRCPELFGKQSMHSCMLTSSYDIIFSINDAIDIKSSSSAFSFSICSSFCREGFIPSEAFGEVGALS